MKTIKYPKGWQKTIVMVGILFTELFSSDSKEQRIIIFAALCVCAIMPIETEDKP